MKMSQNFLKNSIWKHLWLNKQIVLIIFILFNLLLSSVTGYFTPRLISDFYQSLGNKEVFNLQFRDLVFLFVVEYLNRFFFQVSTHRYIQLLLMETRQKSFSLWLRAPFRGNRNKKDEYPLGEVLSRLMNDTDAIREVVSSGSFAIFIDMVFIASCLISFLQLNSTTGFVLFGVEVLAAILLIKGSRAMASVYMEVRKITGKMARVVTDLTSGLRELFFSPNPKYASIRGDKIFEDFLDKQLKANIWDASYYSAAESLYPILIALLMIIVPFSGIVEVAILAVLIDLIQKSIGPIKEIASKISVLQRASTGLIRISEFNQSFPQEVIDSPNFSMLTLNEISIGLKSFSYDGGFNLKDIDFKLKRGEILGILGESGCGKSTLLKLISGQYDPFEGHIFLDNRLINPLDEHQLRNFSYYVSLISQDSHVFSESVRFNIGLGREEDFDIFWELAIKNIPYLIRWGITPDTKIEPTNLSMGQKQLISGLRALYLRKPIILLDELSSGLDSELELALRDLIHFFQSRCITIIVTHRAETILASNQLLLLDQGRLVARGAPSELKNVEKFKEFLSHL
jgi:ATP-binding cassette, subfamily B, multidrug efflux pump